MHSIAITVENYHELRHITSPVQSQICVSALGICMVLGSQVLPDQLL